MKVKLCKATTKRGTRCGCWAKKGGYCPQHTKQLEKEPLRRGGQYAEQRK